MMTYLMEIVRLYGPGMAVVAFCLWRDWKREGRMSDRQEMLEDEIRGVVIPLVQTTTKTVATNTEVMKRVEGWMYAQPRTNSPHQAGAV